MNFRERKRDHHAPHIDLTPMLDVMFTLVLFFVVTTSFARATDGAIEVELPRSSADMVVAKEGELDVLMTLDGQVYVEGDAVATGDLKRRLSETARKDPKTTIVLRADQGVSHGRVVQVMDLAREYGLTHYAIATEVAEP